MPRDLRGRAAGHLVQDIPYRAQKKAWTGSVSLPRHRLGTGCLRALSRKPGPGRPEAGNRLTPLNFKGIADLKFRPRKAWTNPLKFSGQGKDNLCHRYPLGRPHGEPQIAILRPTDWAPLLGLARGLEPRKL